MTDKSGHAEVTPSSFSEIPIQVGLQNDTPVKQAAEVSMANAIQTFMLMESRSKAEAAELQKRLILQQFRPCKLYPVLIYHDGFRWICEYASMKQQFREYEGTDAAAYGMSPEEAMQNFDKLWVGSSEEELEEEEKGSEDEDV
jgi:hypothetical protein